MKHSTIILWMLLMNWHFAATAQVYTKARLFTTQKGLSDNSINCFYKDRQGYMWIGTRHGLNRYNGHSFTVFQPAAENAISNEIINSITGEKDGTLWVATMNGLNYYEPAEDRWHTIMPGTITDSSDLPNSLVWEIAFTRDSLLWIASDVFEFSSYNINTKKFTYYDWPAFAKTLANKDVSPYASIQKFVVKSDHEFWLGTTKGLVQLDTETKEFKWLGAGYFGNVTALAYDSASGKVFLSAESGQSFVYDEKNKIYSGLRPEPAPYPSNRFTTDRYNEIWLASINGLLKIAPATGAARLCRHIPGFSESLLPGAVRVTYRDDMGLRWVGTSNGFALYDRAGSDMFLPLLPVSDKASVNNMGGVYFDEVSSSYFVCSHEPAAVFMVPTNGEPIQKFTASSDGKLFSNCNSVKIDNENNTWLMTDKNVYRFDRINRQFVLFNTPNQGSLAGIRAFVQDGLGNYWFGSAYNGIYHYRAREKDFDSIPFIFLPYTKKIGSLAYDPHRKSVWISAYSSDVIRYDLPTGKMEGFEDRPGLSGLNLVNDLIIDRRGNTWMATSGSGIYRFNAGSVAGTSWHNYKMKTGLPGNTFLSLCEDANENIWLLSERGIDIIDSAGKLTQANRQAFNFSNYTSDTRIPYNIYFNNSRNEIAVAVAGGLYILPAAKEEPIRRFPVVVTGIRIGSRDSTTAQSPQQLLQQLPFHYNQLHVDFAGLYYGSPENIFYEYKLSGYDHQWQGTETFSADYQNLPAGTYHFQVRARFRNGQMAGESPGFTFQIIPPFWQTNLFIIGMIVLACAAIAWLVYSLSQKLKAEKILNSFTNSLYGQNSIEDICWDTARNCVIHLGFTDCVIYWYEEDRQLLVQKAAFGPKNPWQREIYNSMAIPLGKGIVGSVAATGKMEIVNNTAKDPRYIVDDEKRLSEICVPVFVDGKLFGVIDSEHPHRNFYTRYHARILRNIAAICSERIARYQAEEKLRGKIARDLHDEMGSTLTSINIMSKVAMEGLGQDSEVKNYLQKIKDNSGRILESIGDMVWVINPANDNFEKLTFRMKEFTAEMLEPLKINYQFHEEGVLPSIQLNVEQRKEIYMIFKEAITNVAKYSNATELFITLSEKDGLLSMIITDKGAGFDPQLVTQGNGLKNMKARAARIGAEINIESAKTRGTTIFFHLAISPDRGMTG